MKEENRDAYSHKAEQLLVGQYLSEAYPHCQEYKIRYRVTMWCSICGQISATLGRSTNQIWPIVSPNIQEQCCEQTVYIESTLIRVEQVKREAVAKVSEDGGHIRRYLIE
jgi:hypothetical protein